jgi:organic hydroperoxide reductase OsmC/OhrA
MQEAEGGGGEFVQVELRPAVRIAPGCDATKAAALHQEAHRFCFIARSVKFPVEIRPEIGIG